MKQMTTNEVVYDYQAPSVEVMEVAVETGFAVSGTPGPSEAGGGDSPEEMGWG